MMVLRFNNAGVPASCGICGEEFDPRVGLEAWLEGADALVCRSCVRLHEPELAVVLARLDADDRAEEEAEV